MIISNNRGMIRKKKNRNRKDANGGTPKIKKVYSFRGKPLHLIVPEDIRVMNLEEFKQFSREFTRSIDTSDCQF